jgi:hypothetical protein
MCCSLTILVEILLDFDDAVVDIFLLRHVELQHANVSVARQSFGSFCVRKEAARVDLRRRCT